ncbi:MAG: hypothetical protein A2Z96_04895 [Spirochaetes bacterium GWB1_48_6]|nr:MAG: hypothetical protein A2Z96_04895 [Spirochaetes bacterium GWB1_48_6]
MRDAFDHYYAGWHLISDQTPEEQAAFAKLIAAVRKSIEDNPEITEAWRIHQFDDKASVFKVFFMKFLETTTPSADLSSIISQVKIKLKL